MSASACAWRQVNNCRPPNRTSRWAPSGGEPELATPFFLRNFTSLPVAWELEAPVTVGQP